MGLLGTILLLPLAGPVKGLVFLAEQIKQEVDREMREEEASVRGELLESMLSFEQGKMGAREYRQKERLLGARLRAIRRRERGWQRSRKGSTSTASPAARQDSR